MLEAIGYIGSTFLAICGLPQAIQSYKNGHSHGMNFATVLLWFSGEVLVLVYILPKKDLPLLLNYLSNLAIVGTILKYKIWPRAGGRNDNSYGDRI